MSLSSWYFLILKCVWMCAELLLIMLCEKWMEIITGEPAGVTIMLFVYYLGIYLFSLLMDRVPGLFARPVLLCIPMIGSGAAWLVIAVLQLAGPAWLVYTILILNAYLSVVMYTCSSIVMDERVGGAQKPFLLSFQDISCSVIGMTAYWTSGYSLVDLPSVHVALGLVGVLYLVSFFILHRYVRLPVIAIEETPDEELQLARVQWIAPILLFAMYVMAELFYSGIDPLHTVYVQDVLQQGQEVTFRFVAVIYLGGMLGPLFAPWLLRRFPISQLFFILFTIIAVYFTALWLQLPIMALYGWLLVVGFMAHVVYAAMLIQLHTYFSGATLARYLLIYQQCGAIAPCASFAIISIASGVLHLSIFIMLLCFVLLIATSTATFMWIHTCVAKPKTNVRSLK